MSVIELATMRAKPGLGDDMSKALPGALAVIAVAKGCLGASALRGVERSDEFVLRVHWVSVAAHENFRMVPDFARYRAAFVDQLEEVVGFAHYVEI